MPHAGLPAGPAAQALGRGGEEPSAGQTEGDCPGDRRGVAGGGLSGGPVDGLCQ